MWGLWELSCHETLDLLLPGRHPMLVKRRRAAMIVARCRMLATLFSVLTPMWVVIDAAVFQWPLWGMLAAERVLVSVMFAFFAFTLRRSDSMVSAYRALFLVLVIPAVFFLASYPLVQSHLNIGDSATLAAGGYGFLPFVMAAMVGIFPLTALEALAVSIPFLAVEAGLAFLHLDALAWTSTFGACWLLALLVVVATISSMSHLHFMVALVDQAANDILTNAFTRQTGEELLDMQYRTASRHGGSLAVAFIDLDNFKTINDRYGHDCGDHALQGAASALRKTLRRGDFLVRWGGDEFLAVLPSTTCAGAVVAVARLRETGLGIRPDGGPLARNRPGYSSRWRPADCQHRRGRHGGRCPG